MIEYIPFILFIVVIGAFGIVGFIHSRQAQREFFVFNFVFPEKVRHAVQAHYPHLSDGELALVEKALRHFFMISGRANGKMVSMPSQVVDVAWHEFILFTRKYQAFCQNALGRFLHHTPAEAMHSPTTAQAGIKLAWKLACQHEKINPKNPVRLPLIFAIDGLLNISDGYRYTLNCSPNGNAYCGSDIGCGGGCEGGGDSSDASDGGSGCGGD